MEGGGLVCAEYKGGVGNEKIALGLRGGLYGSGMGDTGREGGRERGGIDGTDSRR